MGIFYDFSPIRKLSVSLLVCVFVLIGMFFQVTIAFSSPDLTATQMETDNLSSNCQSLEVAGTISVTVDNIGITNTGSGFTVLLFEDVNGNGLYDPGTDNDLGSGYFGSLAKGDSVSEDINTAGTMSFSGNLIYAYADSEDNIDESDEANNYYNTGLNCQFEPVPGTFDPEIEWSWTASAVLPDFLNVMMTPGIIDLNEDGTPDVVFGATNFTSGALVPVGVLRALNGANGSELFTVTDSAHRINTAASVAVGDIDLDGKPEILACDESGARLIAFEHDGTFKWRSPVLEAINWGAPSVADLDGDGTPEIVVGRQVLNNLGTILWTGTVGRGSQGYFGPLSLVADVNMDGNYVVAGNTVYGAAGVPLWQRLDIGDGYNAVANFDDDSFPEIVLVTAGTVYLLEHTGDTKWGPKPIPGGGFGGPPTIADYDNDGEVEIGVAGATRYAVFETDGTLKWSAVTQDSSSTRTGSSVFDFEGDGSAEVVYSDELTLRIYRGTDGTVLFQRPLSSCTWHEYPLVADVDADGNAEIVAVANNNCGFGTERGIFVIGDLNDSWVDTRKIWNQHTYHITNVNDNGTIPVSEGNNWELFNNYRQNLQTEGSPLAAPDLTASYLQVDSTVCPDSINIIARIGNGGSNVAAAPVDVAFYDGGTLLGVVQTTQDLNPGEFEDVTLTLTSPLTGPRTICVVADDDGTGAGSVSECDETNNQCCAELTLACNQPPVAVCMNITVPLDENGEATITATDVDGGSTDPDGDPIELSIDKSDFTCADLGENIVTLTVADGMGGIATCEATVTVLDVTPPEVFCNAPDTIVPPDAPISFTVTAEDNCGVSLIEIIEYDCYKYTKKGKRIDKTESCAVSVVGDMITILDSGGVDDHITWTIEAVDESGNKEETTCEVLVVNPGK